MVTNLSLTMVTHLLRLASFKMIVLISFCILKLAKSMTKSHLILLIRAMNTLQANLIQIWIWLKPQQIFLSRDTRMFIKRIGYPIVIQLRSLMWINCKMTMSSITQMGLRMKMRKQIDTITCSWTHKISSKVTVCCLLSSKSIRTPGYFKQKPHLWRSSLKKISCQALNTCSKMRCFTLTLNLPFIQHKLIQNSSTSQELSHRNLTLFLLSQL